MMRRGRQKKRTGSGSSESKSSNSSTNNSPCKRASSVSKSSNINLTSNQHKPPLTENIYNFISTTATSKTKTDSRMDGDITVKEISDTVSLSVESPKEYEHCKLYTTTTTPATVEQTKERLSPTHKTNSGHLLLTASNKSEAGPHNVLPKSQKHKKATITKISAKLAVGAATHRVSLLNLFFFILSVGTLGLTLYCNVRQSQQLNHVLELAGVIEEIQQKLFLIIPSTDGQWTHVSARQERDLHRLRRDISQLQLTRRQQKRRQTAAHEEELSKSTECACTVGKSL